MEAYARALEEARRGLAATPKGVIAAGAGVELEHGVISLPMLDRVLTVTYPQGRVTAGGRRPSLGEEILALHYLARAAGALAPDDLVRFAGLPGATAYADAFESRAELPLAREFARTPDVLVAALSRLGAVPERPGQGEGLWWVRVFPNLPMALRLGGAVEGLPAACSLLFPRRAGYLHHVEDLAVAGELLAVRVLSLAGVSVDDILYTDSPSPGGGG